MSRVPIVLERHRARRLAIYSHKGGVGKTTLTANLGFALQSKGKSVLFIDSDPQCNISSYLLDSSYLDKLLDQSDGPDGQTVWSSLKWVDSKAQSPFALTALERPGRIRLLPGDIRLSEFEEGLSHYWKSARLRDLRGFGGITALSLVTNSLCAAYDVDYVFYDCSPNIGPLNRCILLDCDEFLVPAACDEFSIRAIRTLGYSIARWIADWSDIADLAPDGTFLLPGRPRFLGYIAQQFKVYGGEITSEYRGFLNRIDRHVKEDIIAVLNKLDPTLVDGRISSDRFGEVRNLSGLVSSGQSFGKPLWQVDGGNTDLRETAKNAFMEMADRLIALEPKQERKDA